MKKLMVILAMAGVTLGLQAQTFFFDFGGSGSRGTLTDVTAADANGNYWNNIAPAEVGATSIAANTAFTGLQDSEGNATGVSLLLTTAWGVNSAGGLTTPDAALLGDLALATATTDYMFNTNNTDGGRSFVIRGLDATKGYRFTIFGSRSAGDKREALYSITGQNGWATMMNVAGAGIGHNGENQNTDNTPVSDIVYPAADGTIIFFVNHAKTTYHPINCMKMETVEGSRTLDGTLATTMYIDFGSNGTNTSRGVPTTDTGWNNLVNNSDNNCTDGTSIDLVYSDGSASGATLTTVGAFTANGASSGGGLITPDAALLGDMAVASATTDYMFVDKSVASRAIEIAGLNPGRSYRFTIFASRSASDYRAGLYQFEGLTDYYGVQLAAGQGIGRNGENQNTGNLLITDPIFPTKEGKITLTMVNNQGVYFPINVAKIEELTGVTRPEIVDYKGVAISGDCIAAGEATELIGDSRTNWHVWARLTAGELTVSATDEYDNVTTGTVAVAHDGIYRVDVDLESGVNASLFECTYFCVEGSAVGGWNTTGLEMSYIGAGKWNYKGAPNGYDKFSDSGRVNFIMNKSWTNTYKRGTGNTLLLSDGSDIPLNPGTYDITVDLNAMTWRIDNGLDGLEPYRISVMGSSVGNGEGAVLNDNDGYKEGYIYQYNKLLDSRFSAGMTENPFYMSNICINGNSTVNLLNRIDDLEREYGSYVVFALSLGNEGIHGAANQTAIYNQWITNMQNLISQARAQGKTPVVCNNYVRADFNASDYEHVKAMNVEIGSWDVPSFNLFGAIDNGSGQWADGYGNGDDIYHPNTDGHTEFFYTLVPSLFDALAAGKELTMSRTIVTEPWAVPAATTIDFTPESTVHSFTVAVSATAPDGAVVLTATDADKKAIVVKRSGANYVLTVEGVEKATVAGTSGLDEIVLSQNYAGRKLVLTVNGVASLVVESAFAPVTFAVGDATAAKTTGLALGELMIYRSSMHTMNPFAVPGTNNLNKSSLEFYTAFNDVPAGAAARAPRAAATLVNKAMSTSSAQVTDHSSEISGIADVAATKCALSAKGGKGTIAITAGEPTRVVVATATGAVLRSATVSGEQVMSGIAPGLYIVNNQKVIVK